MNRDEHVWGLVDVFVGGATERGGVVLVTNGSGEIDPELTRIPEGKLLLQQGMGSERITLERQKATDSTFNALEVHPAVARKLGLKDDTRYKLSYDPESGVVYMLRWSKTFKQAVFWIDDTLLPGYLSLAPGLLVKLGVQGTMQRLALEAGKKKARFELDIPEDTNGGRYFCLSSVDARVIGLVDGKRYTLLYDQLQGGLRLSRAMVRRSSAAVQEQQTGTSNAQTAAYSGFNRSYPTAQSQHDQIWW